jgi:Flp pilus assembly protein TadG
MTVLSIRRAIPSRLKRLLRERRGVAAIEFALIAPLLLALYFVTMEISLGIETNKKVGRVASMVADLVTQQQSMTKAELEGIMRVGESVMQPYNRTRPAITVTAIEITDEDSPKALVVWSRKMENDIFSAGAPAGSVASLPDQLVIRGSFLVRVDTNLDYRPVVTWSAGQKETLGLAAAFDRINMQETYYLRPRVTSFIACADC